MSRNALKYKITSRPIEKEQLIFYFAEKYAKKNHKNIATLQHKSQKQQSPSLQKITLISKSKPILSFKRNNDINKNRLSNFQMLKNEANCLDDQNAQKFELKSKNLDAFCYILQNNHKIDHQKTHLQQKTRKKMKKSVAQRLFSPNQSSKVRVNTTIANFVPFFPIESTTVSPNKNKLSASNTMHLQKKASNTSVARRYFGSSKKLNPGTSQVKFSERPLKTQQKSDKSHPTLTRSTFTFN